MIHVQCFAHSLNLASQKALKSPTVVRLLDRIRRYLFQTQQHHSQLPAKTQTRPAPATNTQVDQTSQGGTALERFLEQPAIYAALLSKEVRKSEKDIFILSPADIACAEEVLKALKPMKDVNLVMSEESMPTLYHCTTSCQASHGNRLDDTQAMKNTKAAIAHDLGRRYANERDYCGWHQLLILGLRIYPFSLQQRPMRPAPK